MCRNVKEKSYLCNRWQNIETDTFLVHLNQFYADTRFHDFYTQHQSCHTRVSEVCDTHFNAWVFT